MRFRWERRRRSSAERLQRSIRASPLFAAYSQYSRYSITRTRAPRRACAHSRAEKCGSQRLGDGLGPSSFLGSVFLQLGGLFRDEDANVRAAASTALAKLGGAGRRYRRPLRHATCGGHHATCNATYSASLERRRLDVDGSDTQVLTHTLRCAHSALPNTCMPNTCMPKACMRHATCNCQRSVSPHTLPRARRSIVSVM